MRAAEHPPALQAAVAAARAAGELIRRNLRATKKINAASQHDIKLELDVRCQNRIEQILRRAYPSVPILGEEGIAGDPETGTRWVVDPIDGTVNFTYGIPHACVSIALQASDARPRREGQNDATTKFRPNHRTSALGVASFETVVGVVYDPFC